MEIKDSGQRREFDTGAVRDMAEGKGRMDLIPWDVLIQIEDLFPSDVMAVLIDISAFQKTGDVKHMLAAADAWMYLHWGCDPAEAILDLSKHFENGAKKYGEHNWEKGLPCSCYIDSAIRHMMKCLADWDDEPHGVACLWNLVCCAWTAMHKPELNSYRTIGDIVHQNIGEEDFVL